jgi:hypothetical protein
MPAIKAFKPSVFMRLLRLLAAMKLRFLGSIWILDFGILVGASSPRLLPASLAAPGTGAQAGGV